MQKLSLSVSERLNIIHFLPEQSDLLNQITGRDILQKTKLTKEERESAKIYQTQKGVVVDEESDFEKEFEFEKAEFEMLKDGFKKKEESKAITQYTVTLALKIRDAKEITHTESVKLKK